MKWFLVVFMALLLLSCQKEHNLGEDFNKLIGTWASISGDDSSTLIFKSTGIFAYHRSFIRNQKFNVKSIEIGDEVIFGFQQYVLRGRNEIVDVYIAPTFDTLFVLSYDNTENLHLSWENQSYLVKKP
ncbi:MAG: hypothetical protein V4638_00500 [Bacteroidota bacterium]